MLGSVVYNPQEKGVVKMTRDRQRPGAGAVVRQCFLSLNS